MSAPDRTNWYVAENKRLRDEVERLRKELAALLGVIARAVRETEAEGLLPEDHSEIRMVPAASRDVWTKPAAERGRYTREDYERDKKAREKRGGTEAE